MIVTGTEANEFDAGEVIRPQALLNQHLVGRADGRSLMITPSLVIERVIFERNLAKMAEIAVSRGVRLRPHVKTHKCPEIARRQIEAGAVGVSCTTLLEAETMVAAGIPGVLITSPVAAPPSIERLIGLAGRAGRDGLMVVVDDPVNAAALSHAASRLSHPLAVLVDFSSGYHRTGTATEADAVVLARILAASPHLALRGLQAYAGNIQHIEDRAARADRAAWLRGAIARIVAGAAAEGNLFAIVTGAGTGSYDLDEAPYTEIQPGSYLFNDAQYAPVLNNGVETTPFETSLFLQSSVVSTRAEAYVTLDAGVKSLATDGPLPLPARGAAADCTYAFFGDEHGKLFCPTTRPALGAKVELVTPHCDPTVNLHDALHLCDGETLVAIWPIVARGH